MVHGSKVITAKAITGIYIYFSDFINEKKALSRSQATLDKRIFFVLSE